MAGCRQGCLYQNSAHIKLSCLRLGDNSGGVQCRKEIFNWISAILCFQSTGLAPSFFFPPGLHLCFRSHLCLFHKSYPFPILNPFSSVSGEVKALHNHYDLCWMDPGDHKNTVVLHPTESIASHLESSAPGFLPLVQSCVCHTLQPAARLQEGKKHIWSFAVKIKYGYRVKHSIFFVPLSMVYKGWIWLKSGRNINVKYKNKPLHLFTNTWDLIPQVHKTHVPSSRWGSMCSKTKPNATAAPIKILHQRTLKVHLVNTVNFICKYCYLFIYLFIYFY